ncbi:uncharacterized protein Z519_05474 [Cladophialophora bantiana CBS 173.52]|uniref:Uncharacterized protein n=1 Tax=Cladophialophora bantiana (strain ATCC 10958 / CBS 173.52 / CDC B-1940 / NIH 8579) TaxID=1442370 RepID=A0A0D2HLI4_CLAB1|nr:uncharacterized protein Z519_05474 [Cladophialophora bantiana CBS 173.52]KIW94158.1 hypothetical protein Z519_05474 [Cladophialophora bantiana CBS 173.52]
MNKAQTQTPPETVAADSSDDDDDGKDHDGNSKGNGHDNSARPSSSSSLPLRCPWPGLTYIICNVSSGDVLTLQGGEITLAPWPAGAARNGNHGGSVHWACSERKGWLGFRNVASGKFLGYEGKKNKRDRHGRNCHGRLVCVAARHQSWENFCVRPRPQGGYLLLTTHYERLWRVGIRRGVEQEEGGGGGGGGTTSSTTAGGVLAKIDNEDPAGEEIVWEFIKV